MTEKLDKALGVVFNIMKVMLIVLILAMVGILIAHIVFRYILNNSLTWSEELLKILLVWFGMLSVADSPGFRPTRSACAKVIIWLWLTSR